MISSLIYKIKKVFLPSLLNSSNTIKYLRSSGISVGKGTTFYGPSRTFIDISRPQLLKIGEYCKITSGVIILTHDYSRSVLRRVYGEIVGEADETIIGDNVFIGMNSILLMGTKVGNNVIIGAGSVVKGEFPSNVVIAGNPARVVFTLDEYYQKRKKRYVEEAKWYANHFYRTVGRIPTIKEMDPFFPIFLPRDIGLLNKHNLTLRLGGDDYQETIEAFLETSPVYNGFEEFLEACEIK